MSFANIAIAARVFHPFTYRVPEHMTLTPGMRVAVPFHRRTVVGYVLELIDTPPADIDADRCRMITQVLDHDGPTFSKPMLKLIHWLAHYYCAPIGEVCRAALPSQLTRLAARAARRAATPPEYALHQNETRSHPLTLTAEQERSIAAILVAHTAMPPTPILLHGITGSGKTEIYLRVFAELTRADRQAILLVPEIGLTPQLAQRVVERFGARVAIYHSALTAAQRLREWQRMQRGEVSVVVGTRSALFAPLPKLSVIVVDEEHDSSYKQEDGFLYNARDAAVMRAKIEGAVVVLGSATPSLESFANAESGKYRYLELTGRATGAALPRVEIVDMRTNVRARFIAPFQGHVSLSPPLATAIAQTLVRGEQSLLFLNRRGFAHFLLCEACGKVAHCPNCNISLTYHLKKHRLLCHYCDYAIAIPKTCLDCNSAELTPMGSGTERLEAELTDFFPNVRIARLDRDTTARAGTRQRIFTAMQRREIDILIGTQLVTKGHDFPNVTLVGIISADSSLAFPDFRAAERTFQLVTQVAGRAGRGTKPGQVIVQTYRPEHPSLTHAQDHNYRAFFSAECAARESLGYPPFARLANIRFVGNHAAAVQRAAEQVATELRAATKKESRLIFLGPATAPFEKLRGKFRWQLMIKAPSARTLSPLLATLHQTSTSLVPSGVRMSVDVDPVSLL